MPDTPDRWHDWLDPARLARLLAETRTRYVLAWVVALGVAAGALLHSWPHFGAPERGDGNRGHTTIDFGGQWVMGRMVVTGHARHLFDRHHLRTVLEESYPRADEAPGQELSDVEDLLEGMMGTDLYPAAATRASFLAPLAARDPLAAAALLRAGQSAWTDKRLAEATAKRVGGPLYPPVHAVLYAPLALLRPQPAYRLMLVLNVVLVFVCGGVVSRLSEGRLWCPVVAVVLVLFPGYGGAIKLGQNPMISLTLLLVGWWLMARGRPALGGVVWGVLAFKPVWGLAFGPALLLTRRWRAAAAMLLTGAGLAALTLPVVGWDVWMDWRKVGEEAAQTYKISETWIFLSRDLVGVPRRFLTFPRHGAPEPALVTRLGQLLWLTPPALTAVVALVCPRRVGGVDGPGPAFVLFGAWLSCFHFMYYDSLLAALPVALLFTRPGRYLALRFWPRPPAPPPEAADLTVKPEALEHFRPRPREALAAGLFAYYRPTLGSLEAPPVPLLPGGRAARWVRNPFVPTVLLVTLVLCHCVPGLMHEEWKAPPLDTAGFLLLWAWCGWRVLRGEPAPEDDKKTL